MKRLLALILITSLCVPLSSCKTLGLGGPIKDNVQEIYQNTTKTRSEADVAAKEAPIIAPRMQVIKESQNQIDSLASNIGKSSTATDKELLAIKKENESLKNKNSQLYSKWLYTIIIAAGLFCTVSVALFLLGHFKSLTFTVLSASVLLGAIALQFLLQYLIWIGLGVTIIVAGCVVYAVWKNKNALKQTVRTVEETKPLIADQEAFKAKANSVQNQSTRNIVSNIQKSIKKEKNAAGKTGTLGRIINKLR